MKIRLLYFARLREQLKTEAEMLHLDDEQVLLADVLNALRARGGVWQESLARDKRWPLRRPRIADEKTAIKDNDEVAIFPPVTGG